MGADREEAELPGDEKEEVGLIADIAEVMENMKENGERATPETVLALAVWREGGKRDGKDHEQKQSSEIA